MSKIRRLTEYESSGTVDYEETLDSTEVKKIQWSISIGFVILSCAVISVLGGSLFDIFEFSLIISIPNVLLLIRNLKFAKKVFFRIRSDGIEAGTPYEVGFIPFDRIVWIGPSPKPFSVEVERRFNIVDIQSLYPAPLIVSSKGLLIVFNGISYTFGLMIYPSDTFFDKMLSGVDKEFEARHRGLDST